MFCHLKCIFNRYMQLQVLKIIGLIGLILTGSTFHAQSISGVVNQYVAVTSVNTNSVNVTSNQGFSVGDRVLLIQMKGATISSANNVSFGQI